MSEQNMGDAWRRIDEFLSEMPRTGLMRVPCVLVASEGILRKALIDQSHRQLANVATLPGIEKYALAMPDIHTGYGFPIGGVAAFSESEGIISPGGVGYDINCGCRLITTNLTQEETLPQINKLVTTLFHDVPAGVGSRGGIKLSAKEMKEALQEGARWALSRGLGEEADLSACEDGGKMEGASAASVSQRAHERGREQIGTLGAGNHFVEVEVVEEVFDKVRADEWGLFEGQVTVMIHSGSRGLGHQVCDDFLARMVREQNKQGAVLPDKQLASAPLASSLGQEYFAAMAGAANFAWANRQALTHLTRMAFEKVFKKSSGTMKMNLLYDVAHNIAKMEMLPVGGNEIKKVCVHRKGATRALPPRHPLLTDRYQSTGQPVLIPGDMGSGSFVLAGTQRAYQETFASCCHGAGREMSRSMAIKKAKTRNIMRELSERGITVMATSRATLGEEMPEAYKRVEKVVDVVHRSGLAIKVARLQTLGCVKG